MIIAIDDNSVCGCILRGRGNCGSVGVEAEWIGEEDWMSVSKSTGG